MNKYLLILGAFVDTDDKKEYVLKLLQELRAQNIDVCLSAHTSMGISEFAKYCKYLIFDEDNQPLHRFDYKDNIQYLDETNIWSKSCIFLNSKYARLDSYIPGSPHSMAALKVLKNGIDVALNNGYKWFTYMEYDIEQSPSGISKAAGRRNRTAAFLGE